MRKLGQAIALFFLFAFQTTKAQYYAPAFGLNGASLKTALHQIIANHNAMAWPLWPYFDKTDSTGFNQVWDIYSDKPGNTPPYMFTLGANQCGTYSQESDCYNHEHTWPSTFFNDALPMKSDLHHVFPTDGFVNNKRSNFPYGTVNGAVSWTAQNGAKLGKSNTYPNYTLNVFEPIDSFKGDVARNYFYMSTRYQGEDAGWGNWEMANGANLKDSAIALLLRWHHNDPVSTKEIKRNQAVYLIQNNRNPFIDYPIFADCIWGNADCTGLGLLAVDRLDIQVYPNPCTQQIQFKLPNQTSADEVRLFNVVGQELLFQKNTRSLDVSQLPPACYILQILSNGIHYRERIIKE